MRNTLLVISIALVSATICHAQHGSAPNGYYPMGYNGDTWTGVVTVANDVTREITLTFTKKDKTETFTATLGEDIPVKLRDGSTRVVQPSDIPLNTRIIVFYTEKTKKLNGVKVKYNEIFRFNLASDSGTN